ncbi:MAG: hypothetical protein M2R45_00576 [Verrucomicrobia subdivision 3 bacterium]|nr:hypothetical protein [Limisphaerales bacterium]MCS1413547.1 hypothetical protein [Limisphaerales bacterium]
METVCWEAFMFMKGRSAHHHRASLNNQVLNLDHSFKHSANRRIPTLRSRDWIGV